MAATASFALKEAKISPGILDVLKGLQRTPSLLRRLCHIRPNDPQPQIISVSKAAFFHTNMNSQFSDVRFSSVAFAMLPSVDCLECFEE